MIVSFAAIYLALVVQFNSVTQPLLVYAAVPFGVVGGLIGLAIMGSSFGFMAFLGVASLAGLIISHVIVLFDFIDEKRHEGEPLRKAVVDAGLARLRPVLTTVLATVGGLIPLALEGGPLWEPMCYVQIAGMLVATLVTLVIVPVLYVIFVEDLHLVRWEQESSEHDHTTNPRAGSVTERSRRIWSMLMRFMLTEVRKDLCWTQHSSLRRLLALGSLVGAAASIATTWITQRTQSLRAHAGMATARARGLVQGVHHRGLSPGDRCGDAFDGTPGSIMKLYGILSCIRLMSGQEVVRQGEACCRRIVELYGQPNLTTDQLRVAVAADRVDELDPLKAFSNACRNELLAGQA